MKKITSLLFSIVVFSIVASCASIAATYTITPRAPQASESLKPIIVKYRQEDYIGAMQDLETLVKKEKNNTYAKYYLALCYTRLGYKAEAQTLYKEVALKDDNLALTYYSQMALDCLDDPNSDRCKPRSNETETASQESEDMDDITLFIRSGKMIHPSAMDRITRERMERRLQEAEYQMKMQEQQLEENLNKTDASTVTNEEIAAALNTLSKIGINPYTQQYNPLAQAFQYNQLGLLNNNTNNNLYGAFFSANSNPEITKMLLYSQMAGQQNSLINYGI